MCVLLRAAMRRRRQRQRQQSLAHQSPHHTPSLVSSAFRRNLEASVHLDDDDVEGREQLEHRIRGFGEQISRMMSAYSCRPLDNKQTPCKLPLL